MFSSFTEFANALTMPIYQMCAITWFLVLLYYGQTSLYSWRQRGGTLRRSLRQVLGNIAHYCGLQWRDVRGIKTPPVDAIPAQDSGYYLRGFVALSATNLTVIAASTQFVDRRDWPWWGVCLVIGSNLLSLIAGQGHLLLAWRSRSARWRRGHRIMLVWFVIGFVVSFFYWKGVPTS